MHVSKVEVDLNCGVSFNLTSYGEEIIERELINGDAALIKKHYDKDNKRVINLPFWEFIRVFGQYLLYGMKNLPFVDNKITITDYE
jgi:hypothetical protein